jgi:hypothetical protein
MTAAWGCMEGLCLGCEGGCTGQWWREWWGGVVVHWWAGKEQEGLGRTAQCESRGVEGGGRGIGARDLESFFGGRRRNALENWEIVHRAREIFGRLERRALRITGCWWFFRCVSNYRKASPWSEGRRTKGV